MHTHMSFHVAIYVYMYVYIYTYLLDSRRRAHLTPSQKAGSGTTKDLSAERSPLSDGSGSTKSRLEDHRATPKMRPECGPWTGSPVGPEPAFKLVLLASFHCFPHFAWNPYFYSVLYKVPFKMLNIWAQFWSKLQTLKNQFVWTMVGPFCGPWTARQNGTPNSSRQKNKDTKKITMTTRNPNGFSCGKRKHFWRKTAKIFVFFCLWLLAFLWPTTSKDHSAKKKHYKTRGFVVFLLCFLSLVYPKQEQQQSKQKQATTTKQPTKQKQEEINTGKRRLFYYICLSLFVSIGCSGANEQTNKQTNKQQQRQQQT